MNDDPYDRYDPDRWLAQGKDLQHFRAGGPDAELFYDAHPELRRRVWRSWNMVVQASHRAAYERDVSIPVEDDFRDLWRVVKSETAS
jgi:hypothetical protein